MYNYIGSVSEYFNKLVLVIVSVLVVGAVAVLWKYGITGYRTTMNTTAVEVMQKAGEVIASQ